MCRSVVCPSVAVSHAGFPLCFRMAEDANKSLWPPAADATTQKKTRPGFRTLNTGSFHLNDHRLPLLLERQCSAHRHAHVPFSTLPFSMFSPLSLSCSSFVSLIHSLTDIHGSDDLFNHRGVAAAAAAAGAATVVPRCHLPPVGRRVTRRERVCMRAYCPLSVQRVDRPGKPSREH